MLKKANGIYIAIVLLLAAPVLSFRPAMWLVHKPANSQNSAYVHGWEDGCISGANSYSLLYAPLLERPFIKELELESKAGNNEKNADAASNGKSKEYYKSGWNEGFTMCRFYQSSVYELMQFAMILATLSFIGYYLVRNKKS